MCGWDSRFGFVSSSFELPAPPLSRHLRSPKASASPAPPADRAGHIQALLLALALLAALAPPPAAAQFIAWVARDGSVADVSERPAVGYWNRGYRCLAVDGGGNVYIAGTAVSAAGWDYLIAKHDASGVSQWVVPFSRTADSRDYALAVAVDADGNVYATGYSRIGSNDDYMTVKYNSSGVQQWAIPFNGAADGTDLAYSVAVDGSGNVYVTGFSFNGSNDDFLTIKYDTAGVQQWATPFNGPSAHNDRAYALAVDGSGNVYVTGNSFNGFTTDHVTVKYSTAGVQQWASVFNGTSNGNDCASAVAADLGGNVYATGYSHNGSNYDFLTLKYNASGVQQWAALLNGAANSDDRAHALAVDSGGNVHVTGSSWNSSGTNDYLTVRYDTLGIQQWASPFNGTSNGDDQAYALAIDGAGNTYVVGSSHNGSSYDFATVKYGPNGNPLWTMLYQGEAGGDDQAYAIALDPQNNVIVTGHSSNGLTDDFLTIKYAQQQAAVEFAGTASGVEESTANAAAPVEITTSDGQPLVAAASVAYASANGSATAGSDYTGVASTLAFPAGTPSGTALDVAVPIAQDGATEGAETFTVTLSAPAGAVLGTTAVHTVTILDDDVTGVTVSPVAGLVTTEAGGQSTFTVVLDVAPSADVTIALATSDATEGAVSPASLTFTPGDWSVPQAVTVTGVEDFLDDGDVPFTIVTGDAVSTDPTYSGLAVADVAVTNLDDDDAGITVAPDVPIATSEDGTQAFVAIALTSQPAADVTIAVSSSDTTEATVSTPAVTFTPADWSLARIVTVTGLDDGIEDGDVPYDVVTGIAVSGDPQYGGIDPADVSAANTSSDWTACGPEGGSVTALAVDPQHPGVVYAATQFGGVYRSTDFAATWQPASISLPSSTVRALYMDPTFPTRLFALHWGGISTTANGGGTWGWTGLKTSLFGMGFDSLTPTNLFAIIANPLPPATAQRSRDRGAAWTDFATGLGEPRIVTVDPTSSRVIYVWDQLARDLMKTTNDGASFTPTGYTPTSANSITVNPFDPTRVYVAQNNGLYVSSNGGDSFGVTLGGTPRVTNVWVHPTTGTTLFAAKNELYRSTDGGATWTNPFADPRTWGIGAPKGVVAFAVDTADPDRMYLGHQTAGVYRSTDAGVNWAQTVSGLRATPVTVIAGHPTDPETIWVAVKGLGMYRTTDGSETWQAINTGLPDGADVVSIAVNPAAPTELFIGANSPGAPGWIYRSGDGGDTWALANTGLESAYGDSYRIVIDPLTPSTLYAASSGFADPDYLGAVWKSTNSGGAWSRVTAGMNFSMNCLAIDPSAPATLYACAERNPDLATNGIYRSLNGGGSWSPTGLMGLGEYGGVLRKVLVDPTDSQILYVAAWKEQDYLPGNLIKSIDGGVTWFEINNGFPGAPNASLIIDPTDHDVLHVGTDYGGVFRTDDAGASWHCISRGLATSKVWALYLTGSGAVVQPIIATTGSLAAAAASVRVLQLAEEPTLFAGAEGASGLYRRTLAGAEAPPAPMLQVTHPNGGEVLTLGSLCGVAWGSAGGSGGVTIELSTDGGVTFTPVAAMEPDTGNYNWPVTATPSVRCLLRISDPFDPARTDTSDEPFAIVLAQQETEPVPFLGGAAQGTLIALVAVLGATAIALRSMPRRRSRRR